MGLLRLNSKIVITKDNEVDVYTLNNYINGIEHNTSVEDLTDTAKVIFPYSGKFKGRNLFGGENPLFEIGDNIKIYSGYYPNLYLRFNGWISAISAKTPIEVSCQDHMFQLKNSNITYPQKRITYYYGRTKTGKISKKPLKKPRVIGEAITLRELLEYCLGNEWDLECPDVNLGHVLFTNVSIAKVLDILKEKYGLYSRFRDDTLVVGFQLDATKSNTYQYEFNKAVPWGIIDDSNLEWQLAQNVNIKVVAKLMGLNNTFEEVTVGDTDGAQRTLHFYWDGVTLPKPDIKKLAEEELTSKRYDGYRGSFETFGYYPIVAGDIVNLKSKKFPERDGNYSVTSVNEKLGMDGIRQVIEIGNKV